MTREAFATLAQEAVHCRVCFQNGAVEPAQIDVAQPRWVGPDYWAARPRVAIVMLNPGSGQFRADSADARFRELLRAFREGTGSLDAVLEHQARDMPRWGRGRFASFYLSGLGLDLNRVAFVNVAWCATSGNRYPSAVLNTCFSRHTARLIRLLDPGVVVLSGGATHGFAQQIASLTEGANVVHTLHYAHREGHAAEEAALDRVRAIIATLASEA